MPSQTRSSIRRAESLDCADTLAHVSEIIESPEYIYRRTQSQQGFGYFPESNCREEGSHTPPSSSIAAATVFTSGPSESSDLVSSPPPTDQSQSGDHPSGVADEDPHDSQATESAPEDDMSGLGVEEEDLGTESPAVSALGAHGIQSPARARNAATYQPRTNLMRRAAALVLMLNPVDQIARRRKFSGMLDQSHLSGNQYCKKPSPRNNM
ncbi:hypothetical protein CSIM01_03018 [Colletotrichum simmondsii]|uniref:Uncharacterized protein n=1 Tax=Colletotrichum simmondsii TaxID=703756 RepID=A0A135SL57_9PEZI|nr:hypothetical protein CSIM01_03018 [Colletotrichum simmondsii]